jgi:hypothetical protein
MKKLTQKQVNTKYRYRYIEFTQTYDYTKQERLYEIVKTSNTIRENMTLGQDVWTDMAYTR